MLHILDENDIPILDKNGKQIRYVVDYIETDDWYKHKEGIHINIDGHLDTENRHLIVKEGIDDDHAVSKKQLDQLNNILQNSITTAVNNLKSQITTELQQIKNRIPSKPNSN